jgi:hypothetical protein
VEDTLLGADAPADLHIACALREWPNGGAPERALVEARITQHQSDDGDVCGPPAVACTRDREMFRHQINAGFEGDRGLQRLDGRPVEDCSVDVSGSIELSAGRIGGRDGDIVQ